MKNGRFISLEGLEGVGKTTNREFIEAQLKNASVPFVVTREPGGTALGEALRELLLHADAPVAAHTELLMMTASRKQHLIEVIEPALASGQWVLCDRYIDASFAYQGGGRKLGAELVNAMHELAGITLLPELTLLLDMPVQGGLTRMQARGSLDRIEQEEHAFFERAREAYLARAKASPERIKLIDASGTLDEVQQQIQGYLQPLLDATV